MSFAQSEYAMKKNVARRERFLGEMEQVAPWGRLVEAIKPRYPTGERGRPPVGLERMPLGHELRAEWLRLYFLRQWHGLADGALDWLWAAAQRAGVPIAMLATDSLPHIGRIAERHPGLRLTIDHLGGRGGTTTLKDDAAMEHMPALIKLARHPNVAVKATGAPGYCSGPYPFTSMHPYLRQIYDAFGPARMFWGTDITKMPCSWRQCVTMFTEELPWLPERDKDLVMGQAVCAWWGWS